MSYSSKLRRAILNREAKRQAQRSSVSSSFLFDENAIISTVRAGTLVLPHGPAKASFPIDDAGTLGHAWTIQNAGKRRVSPVVPKWYNVVRTDTTDYVQRTQSALKTRKEW